MNNGYLGYNMGGIVSSAAVQGTPKKREDKRVVLPKKIVDAIDFYKHGVGEELLFNLEKMATRARAYANENAREIMVFVNGSDENRKKYFRALFDGYRFELSAKEKAETAYSKAHIEYVQARVGSPQEAEAQAVKKTIEKMNEYFDLKLELEN